MARIATYATPRRLYRFRPLQKGGESVLDREISAIKQAYVFCPTYSEMNDPMEGTHAESVMLKGAANHDTTIAKVTNAKEKLGIASFSEAVDHEPMWAHYADNFAGICIQYNFRKLLNSLGDDAELVRMAYSEGPPVLLKDKKGAEEMAKLALSSKAVRWSSEREWRLMRPKRGKAPYGEVTCVTAVYLGSRVTDQDRQAIRAALRGLGIPIYQMELDHYAIQFKRVKTLLLKPAIKKPVKPVKPMKAARGHRAG